LDNRKAGTAFPARIPLEEPQNHDLSEAMHRMYDVWHPHEDRVNQLFSNFKYSRIAGIGKDEHTSRRDPSRIIKVGDTYYVWYTRRQADHDPVGAADCTDTLPAFDWDMADVYYATSQDGFNWAEQGVAVARLVISDYGDRSATTPDILVYEGKYYLYFQSFTGLFDPIKGDYCDASMAYADSPEGPWTRLNEPIVALGKEDEWDGSAIHDPYPLVYQGKIWLYYKGQPLLRGPESIIRAQGVAIAERPEGPFVKSPLNPVINSGHETCLFPFYEGIAALVTLDGPEKNTIQYAPDGLNFSVKSHIQMPPIAPGPFCPDAFADNGDGRGITWGLCHITDHTRKHSFLARFDCDLSRDVERSEFKRNNLRLDEHAHFAYPLALSDGLKERILGEQANVDNETQ
jgi:Glycosyl hydrolases family 43